MVTKATNNTAGKPFMELDLQKFAQNRTHTAEEVRNVLESHIRKAIEIPEDLGDDRAAREAYLRKRKEEVAYKNACDELDVYQKNPELYTTLYALKNATNAETVSEGEGDRAKESERANARICEDQNGNLFLAVDIMKPTDISFQIHDGKLYFDPSGMTPDRLKEMLAYLDRRGLASFIDMDSLKLENADQTTGEMFAAAKDDIKQEIGRQGEDTGYSAAAPLAVEQAANDETQTPDDNNNGNGDNTPDIPVTGAIPVRGGDTNKAPADAYENAIQSLTKWMDKNKRRGLSYFVTHKGGYTVFTAFEKENPENMQQDGVIDSKTKDVKTRHECKLYVRMDENGRLEVSFSLPSGKVLNDNYADRIMDAYKDAGIKRVKFGTLSDANETAIRLGCGRALIVPVDLKLSQTKFDKMIDAAEGKNGKNNPKVIKYRRDLALQLAYQLQQKGIQWDDPKNKNDAECRCVRHAVGAYNFSPFRDWWEDFGLRYAYEDIIKANGSGNPDGAAAAIGAAQAVAKLYAAYNDGIGKKDATIGYLVSDQCTSLTPEEKEKFKAYINGHEDIPMREMPPEAAIYLFKTMQETQQKRAKNKIEEEYRKLVKDDFYKGNAARDAVTPYLTEASTEIDNVKTELADIGLPPIVVIRIGTPKHDFNKLKEELRHTLNRGAAGHQAGAPQQDPHAPHGNNGANNGQPTNGNYGRRRTQNTY